MSSAASMVTERRRSPGRTSACRPVSPASAAKPSPAPPPEASPESSPRAPPGESAGPVSVRMMVRRPRGDPSSVTATTSGSPMSRAACWAGLLLVADARITTGSPVFGPPCPPAPTPPPRLPSLTLPRGCCARRASRSSRRSTRETCAPKTPRYWWASSTMTYRRFVSTRRHRFG